MRAPRKNSSMARQDTLWTSSTGFSTHGLVPVGDLWVSESAVLAVVDRSASTSDPQNFCELTLPTATLSTREPYARVLESLKDSKLLNLGPLAVAFEAVEAVYPEPIDEADPLATEEDRCIIMLTGGERFHLPVSVNACMARMKKALDLSKG